MLRSTFSEKVMVSVRGFVIMKDSRHGMYGEEVLGRKDLNYHFGTIIFY